MAPEGGTGGGRGERRPRQDPGRQHVRGQRLPRRHRGVTDRPNRAFLLRHALPLALGADGQRSAADAALDRRPPVFRDALLPRTGDRHGLRRFETLVDSAPRRRQRLPRGVDDPEPRREACRPDDPNRRRLRLRGPLRGQGRPEEEGHILDASEGWAAVAELPAGHLRARDGHLVDRTGPDRQGRPDLQGANRAAGAVVDQPRRRDGAVRGRGVRRPADGRAASRPREHGREPEAVARRRPEARVRLGFATRDIPAQPRRPRRAAVLASDHGPAKPARSGAALVHDDVRPGQHLHEPPGASVRAIARRDDAAGARRVAGNAGRRFPRRGPGTDPPRDALRRVAGFRGTAALAVLRVSGRDSTLRRAARRVRALDGRPPARP